MVPNLLQVMCCKTLRTALLFGKRPPKGSQPLWRVFYIGFLESAQG